MVTPMSDRPEFKPGDHVTYVPTVGDSEHGIVKSVRDDAVFVVYNCAGEWGRYEDYTAANTPIDRLVPGWTGGPQ